MKVKFLQKTSIFIISASLLFAIMFGSVVASATTSSPKTVAIEELNNSIMVPASLGAEIPNSSSGISDSNLYLALLNIYNNHYSGEDGFSPINKVFVNMFIEIEDLDLSSKGITSLTGFNMLNLLHLKTLNLSKNQISSISTELSGLSAIEELNLFNNKISSINTSNLVNLTNLNLSRNYLRSINISAIKQGVVRLSFNRLESINHITFPHESNITTELFVELFNNNITNAESVIDTRTKLKLELGLQGIGLNNREIDEQQQYQLFTTTLVKYYNVENYDINIEVYRDITNELLMTIENDQDTYVTTYTLPVGSLYTKYVYAVNQQDVYSATDEIFGAFKGYSSINVLPPRPVVVFNIDGKNISSTRQRITKDSKLVISSDIEGAVFFYKIGLGEWTQVQNNEIKLEYGVKDHTVTIKQVVEGVDSYSLVVDVLSEKAMSPVLAVLIFIAFIAAFFGSLPFLRKFLNK